MFGYGLSGNAVPCCETIGFRVEGLKLWISGLGFGV